MIEVDKSLIVDKPPRARAWLVKGCALISVGVFVVALVTGLPSSVVASRLIASEGADEKRSGSHHHSPPPPFPFATSAFAFDGVASRRCVEMVISSCPETHPQEVEWYLTWKKCCPLPAPDGVCYHSDKCFHECAEGYEEVASAWSVMTCDDLCCTAGRPGPFWFDRCWAECPEGYSSVLKAPMCWDLCVPNGQVYEQWELTRAPYSDKGVSQTGHHMLGGGLVATAVGR